MPRLEPGGACSGHKSPQALALVAAAAAAQASVAARLKAKAKASGEAEGEGGGAEAEGEEAPPWEAGVCGDACENRQLRVECCGEDGAPPSGGGGEKGRGGRPGDKWANCRAGGRCGNRQIGLRQGAVKVVPFKEEGRGWGLKLGEPVRQGQLVREYVGEVLDVDALQRRMAEHQRLHPGDVNM